MLADPPAAPALGSGLYGLSHPESESAVVVVPVPFGATTSYRTGTAGGPAAILAASRQVDLFDAEHGRPYRAGIHMLPIPEHVVRLDAAARADALPVIAAGGVRGDTLLAAAAARVNAASAEVNGWVEGQVGRLLAAGKQVGVVGGDHSIAFGSIAAHARAFPGVGVLHVDAHPDLRRAFQGFEHSHASVLFNAMERLPGVARLVQVGIRDLADEDASYIEASGGRIVTHYDALLAAARFEGETWGAQLRRILEPLPRQVYVTFDVDGLDPALCPHTGTPVPGGLSFRQACALLSAVPRSGRRIVGFDLVEVAPGPAGDEWDGNVGARLLYKLIGAMLRQG